MAAVTVDRLIKGYNGIPALREVSFSVGEAELFGIIGPDGAGKSTFMRIAACLLKQDGGTLAIRGFDSLTHTSRIKRIIGYMPQRFSLYPDLTVRENLVFFADLFGVPKNERKRRIDRLLEFSRLGPFLDRRAEKLSGGMKQKLALSCTLVHTPEVLFLDEPTTGVDPVSRQEFWNLLADIKRDGTTIIVSTPYMDEAERCDRVAFITNGTILMIDTPSAVPGSFKHTILTVRAPGIVRAARSLTFPPEVLDMQTFGDRIHLTVDDADAAGRSVDSMLTAAGFADVSIERATPSMEDVFMEKMSDA